MRHFEPFDRLFIPRDHLADRGQSGDRHDDFVDGALEMWRQKWPGLRKNGAGPLVDPVHRETSFVDRNWFERFHGGKIKPLAGTGMVADNGCLSVNGGGSSAIGVRRHDQ